MGKIVYTLGNMEDSYLRIELSNRHWELSHARSEKLPIMNKSHRGHKANQVGCLGEVIIEEFFNSNGVYFKDDRSKYTHDYEINKRFTLDVKTKDRTVVPKFHYENSVPVYQMGYQKPDFYYFVSLYRDKETDQTDIRRFTEGYIVGGINRNKLHKVGTLWEKDSIDESNGTHFWTDCINIKMSDLISNNSMINIFT